MHKSPSVVRPDGILGKKGMKVGRHKPVIPTGASAVTGNPPLPGPPIPAYGHGTNGGSAGLQVSVKKLNDDVQLMRNEIKAMRATLGAPHTLDPAERTRLNSAVNAANEAVHQTEVQGMAYMDMLMGMTEGIMMSANADVDMAKGVYTDVTNVSKECKTIRESIDILPDPPLGRIESAHNYVIQLQQKYDMLYITLQAIVSRMGVYTGTIHIYENIAAGALDTINPGTDFRTKMNQMVYQITSNEGTLRSFEEQLYNISQSVEDSRTDIAEEHEMLKEKLIAAHTAAGDHLTAANILANQAEQKMRAAYKAKQDIEHIKAVYDKEIELIEDCILKAKAADLIVAGVPPAISVAEIEINVGIVETQLDIIGKQVATAEKKCDRLNEITNDTLPYVVEAREAARDAVEIINKFRPDDNIAVVKERAIASAAAATSTATKVAEIHSSMNVNNVYNTLIKDIKSIQEKCKHDAERFKQQLEEAKLSGSGAASSGGAGHGAAEHVVPVPDPDPEDTPAPVPVPEDTPALVPVPEDTPALVPVPADTPALVPVPEDTPALVPVPADPPAPVISARATFETLGECRAACADLMATISDIPSYVIPTTTSLQETLDKAVYIYQRGSTIPPLLDQIVQTIPTLKTQCDKIRTELRLDQALRGDIYTMDQVIYIASTLDEIAENKQSADNMSTQLYALGDINEANALYNNVKQRITFIQKLRKILPPLPKLQIIIGYIESTKAKLDALVITSDKNIDEHVKALTTGFDPAAKNTANKLLFPNGMFLKKTSGKDADKRLLNEMKSKVVCMWALLRQVNTFTKSLKDPGVILLALTQQASMRVLFYRMVKCLKIDDKLQVGLADKYKKIKTIGDMYKELTNTNIGKHTDTYTEALNSARISFEYLQIQCADELMVWNVIDGASRKYMKDPTILVTTDGTLATDSASKKTALLHAIVYDPYTHVASSIMSGVLPGGSTDAVGARAMGLLENIYVGIFDEPRSENPGRFNKFVNHMCISSFEKMPDTVQEFMLHRRNETTSAMGTDIDMTSADNAVLANYQVRHAAFMALQLPDLCKPLAGTGIILHAMSDTQKKMHLAGLIVENSINKYLLGLESVWNPIEGSSKFVYYIACIFEKYSKMKRREPSIKDEFLCKRMLVYFKTARKIIFPGFPGKLTQQEKDIQKCTDRVIKEGLEADKIDEYNVNPELVEFIQYCYNTYIKPLDNAGSTGIPHSLLSVWQWCQHALHSNNTDKSLKIPTSDKQKYLEDAECILQVRAVQEAGHSWAEARDLVAQSHAIRYTHLLQQLSDAYPNVTTQLRRDLQWFPQQMWNLQSVDADLGDIQKYSGHGVVPTGAYIQQWYRDRQSLWDALDAQAQAHGEHLVWRTGAGSDRLPMQKAVMQQRLRALHTSVGHWLGACENKTQNNPRAKHISQKFTTKRSNRVQGARQ